MLGASFAVSPVQAQEADPSELMKVTDYELVSKKRVGRTVFEYEYALTVENNTNTDYDGVFVTLTSPNAAFELTDATANIGAFSAFSSKGANDTIKVRVDRRARFNPLNLTYAFDDDTIEGIDTDNNGLRDSVEQNLTVLATSEFPLEALIKLARILSDQLVVDSTALEETRRTILISSLEKSLCVNPPFQRGLESEADKIVFNVVLNRSDRLTKYRNDFGSLSISGFTPPSDEDCIEINSQQ